jgi:outer membrane protein
MPGPGPSTQLSRFTRLALLAAALPAVLPTRAAAEDLMQVFRDAQVYDATYAAAKRSLEAGKEKGPQGLALLLPTLGLSANATRSRTEVEFRDPSASALNSIRSPDQAGYTLTFTQPVFRYQNWIQYDQGQAQVKQAEATYANAYQDLITRVAQAYFDVLASQDTLTLVRAQKEAIAEQLEQAKRNFEVGTATITDTHEAQARYDLSGAQEIAAANDLEAKRRVLQLITGKEYAELKPLRADIKMPPPNPNDMESWAELAGKQGYAVQVGEAGLQIAQLEAKRNRAAHLPTLDFFATYGQSGASATSDSNLARNTDQSVIGLQLAMPLYQGGGLSSRDRESAALALKARDDLDNARRTAVLTERQIYLSVINGIAQVAALEQALVSSTSALDSNKLGYEVGVRINIDVLNAQQQVFSTKRDLALARYNTLINHLRLKAGAATLREEDLEVVNRALGP